MVFSTMLTLILYSLAIISLLLFLIFMTAYSLLLIYSSFMGSPYVPTKQKEIELILRNVTLKRGGLFYELGCGDGRVVRAAVKKYNVKGIGIDINPLMVLYARLFSKIQNIPCTFKRGDLLDLDYRIADYIYLFLMPGLIKKLVPIIKSQAKRKALIISHGFRLIGMEKFLIKHIPHTPFPTFIYRLT